nr:hypothetical protein LR48_Vigan10g278900 [Ipomoea trifida]
MYIHIEIKPKTLNLATVRRGGRWRGGERWLWRGRRRRASRDEARREENMRCAAVNKSLGGVLKEIGRAGNILVDTNGAVKLAYFGVSTCMFDTGDRQRSRNSFLGTPCCLLDGSGSYATTTWIPHLRAAEYKRSRLCRNRQILAQNKATN